MAILLSVCRSDRKEDPKKPEKIANIDHDRGVRGDSHYGFGFRQISLLRQEDVEEAAQKAGFPFPYGSLAENLRIEGVPEEKLQPGKRLSIGETVVLEVVEKGKKPEEPHSYDYRGWCLLPKVGYFLRVLSGGRISPGDEIVPEE
ncbi:MAG: MOSC domain-containing protein [Thermovirgaceae bacterium]